MEHILSVLAEVSIYAAVIALVVLIIRRCFAKRINPVFMLALWAVVLIRFCLPVTFDSPVHIDALFPSSIAESESNTLIPDTNENKPHTIEAPHTENEGIRIPAATSPVKHNEIVASPQITAPEAKTVSPFVIVSGIWFAGAACVIGMFAVRAARLSAYVRGCRKLSDEQILTVITEKQTQLGIRRKVAVKVCDKLYAPALYGVVHPVILLPKKYLEMSIYDLKAIFSHELMHLKKHDILSGYVWLIAKAAHWFNPLIWIAHSKYLEDVELCRDSQAATLMEDGAIHYGSALLNAARFAEFTSDTTIPAASLFKKKSALKERIVRVVKPQKRSKALSAVSALVIVIAAMLCFTTACQPTPESVYVIPKENILETIESSNKKETGSENGLIENSISDIPDEWIETADVGVDGFNLSINAEISKPETNVFPIYEVLPKRFDQKTVDKLKQYFAGDKQLFYLYNQPTKSELEKILIEYKRGVLVDDEYVIPSENDPEILRLEQAILAAPEAIDDKYVDTTLQIDERGHEILYAGIEWSDNEDAEIYVENSSSDNYTSYFRFSRGGNPLTRAEAEMNSMEFADPTITFEQAKIEAEQALKELGVNDFVLSAYMETQRLPLGSFNGRSSNYQSSGYFLCYVKCVDDIPVVDSSGNGMGVYDFVTRNTDEYLPDYTTPWHQESIQLYVDDLGVTAFYWTGYSEIIDTVSENSKLIPFEEIKEQIKKQIYYQNARDLMYDKTVTVNINKIDLGYALINKQNEQGVGLYVPAWYVFFEVGVKSDPNDPGSLDNNVLIINAIDKSVIDPLPMG